MVVPTVVVVVVVVALGAVVVVPVVPQAVLKYVLHLPWECKSKCGKD